MTTRGEVLRLLGLPPSASRGEILAALDGLPAEEASPSARLATVVDQIARERGLSFDGALSEAKKTHADLVEDVARHWIRSRR